MGIGHIHLSLHAIYLLPTQLRLSPVEFRRMEPLPRKTPSTSLSFKIHDETRLNSLPEDAIHVILLYVLCERGSLNALSRTCHRLRALSMKLLFTRCITTCRTDKQRTPPESIRYIVRYVKGAGNPTFAYTFADISKLSGISKAMLNKTHSLPVSSPVPSSLRYTSREAS